MCTGTVELRTARRKKVLGKLPHPSTEWRVIVIHTRHETLPVNFSSFPIMSFSHEKRYHGRPLYRTACDKKLAEAWEKS